MSHVLRFDLSLSISRGNVKGNIQRSLRFAVNTKDEANRECVARQTSLMPMEKTKIQRKQKQKDK
jgi:hypothetical protein